MSQKIFIRQTPEGYRRTLWQDGRLIEFWYEGEDPDPMPGDLYCGRLRRLDRSLGGAFFDLGEDNPAFLRMRPSYPPLSEGGAYLVQVTRLALSGKAPRVTLSPKLAGGGSLIYQPREPGVDFTAVQQNLDAQFRQQIKESLQTLLMEKSASGGFAIQLNQAAVDLVQLLAEAAMLVTRWQSFEAAIQKDRTPRRLHTGQNPLEAFLLTKAGRNVDAIIFDTRRGFAAAEAFCRQNCPDRLPRLSCQPVRQWVPSEDELTEALNAAMQNEVPLPSGGWLLFERGETLTAIDVNSGEMRGGSLKNAESRALQVNREAALEIARQVRLRQWGGIFVVDFINMRSHSHQRQILETLRDALQNDPAECQVAKALSSFGLAEFTRATTAAALTAMVRRFEKDIGG